MRYVLDLNAREAMHLIELRSGREGHPGYRAVAQEMHALIAEQHPAVAATMTHVDTDAEPRLERILAEMRTRAPARLRAPARSAEPRVVRLRLNNRAQRSSMSAASPSSTRSSPNA